MYTANRRLFLVILTLPRTDSSRVAGRGTLITEAPEVEIKGEKNGKAAARLRGGKQTSAEAPLFRQFSINFVSERRLKFI